MSYSVNRGALPLVLNIIDHAKELSCIVHQTSNGSTIIDAGIETNGGYELGRLISEVCMGGLGCVRIAQTHIGRLTVPSVVVGADRPKLATLASQFAGWHVKLGDFSAIVSGPARAQAIAEKDLFAELNYRDDSDVAILVLETKQMPSSDVLQHLAEKCQVRSSDVYCIVVPTCSIAGSIQSASRIVQVGVNRLRRLGLSPDKIRTGHGVAPIAPLVNNDNEARSIANYCIIFGGTTYFHIYPDESDDLQSLVRRAPSNTPDQYGAPLFELFRSVNFDANKLDMELFAPAEITLVDVVNHQIYKSGQLNPQLLEKALTDLEGAPLSSDCCVAHI